MRGVISALIAGFSIIVVLGGFYVGYLKLGDPNGPDVAQSLFAMQAATSFAILSALAWALSVLGDAEWNARFNFAAAVFAAVTTGYYTPYHLFNFA
jgi:hypothetical protein